MSLTRLGVKADLVVWGCAACKGSFITPAEQFAPKWCPYCHYCRGAA